jgi:hypothetical protein
LTTHCIFVGTYGFLSSIWGNADFVHQQAPVQWHPAEAGFAEKYDVPREDWWWRLRGVDPMAARLTELENKKTGSLAALQFSMDKFHRG